MIPLILAAAPAFGQMSLPGKFEVTDTGSASYTIPVSVVPGTAGLEPKLSLQYDSRGGNGLLGVGWSLAGLPAITRCGRTIAQDGAVGGVAYDANDRFCLDGQRLVALNGATYGADGTEYRTERESFSKVISYGTAGSGPDHFVVWTKAGLIMEFGNTADSRIEAQGKTSVRVWAINKTSDTRGNSFTVGYIEDTANGEYRPDRIDYTGNASANTSPTNSVRFVYETRPDIVPLYQAGSLIRTTQRLATVQAWQGSAEVREYRLGYQQSGDVGLSLLNSMALCDVAGNCFPATNITWENGDGSFTVKSEQILESAGYTASGGWLPPQLADVNGDGQADVIMTAQTSDGLIAATVSFSNGDGSFTVKSEQILESAGYTASGGWLPPRFADVNGDGRADVVMLAQDTGGVIAATVAFSNGDGSFTVKSEQILEPAGYTAAGGWLPPQLADVNGDGRADVVMTVNQHAIGTPNRRAKGTPLTG